MSIWAFLGVLGGIGLFLLSLVLWAWKKGADEEKSAIQEQTNVVLEKENKIPVPVSSADADDRLSKL